MAAWRVGLLGICAMTVPLAALAESSLPERPNILFFIIDDQNDLVAALGNPRIHTPNLDRLAARSVLFTQAYCSAPACGPSRSSLLSGLRPSTSGIYYNSQPNSQDPRQWLREAVNLPQHFKNSGYTVGLYGKVFHAHNQGEQVSRYATPGYFSEHTGFWANIPDDVTETLTDFRYEGGANFAWGPVPDDWERPGRKLIDTENADKVIVALGDQHERPFFLTLGFLRPHLPWVAPQSYFDLYPESEIEIPKGYRPGDLDDLPECAKWMAREVPGHTFGDSNMQAEITAKGEWKRAIQAYEACMAYTDAQLGRVLDALDAGPYADNTIIVLASDHGYHLGEKEHWTKFGLWEKTVRVPLMIARPGHGAQTSASSVSLLDLYPTLVALAGIEPPASHQLEGVDLSPILADTGRSRGRPVLSTYGFQCHTLRDDRFRYIRYRNGDEELYDHADDPYEWTNLATEPAYHDLIARFRSQLPTLNTPESDSGANLGWDAKVFSPGYRYQP